MTVHLKSLATATPPHELPQDLVLETARRLYSDKFPQFERMTSSFATSGVERRYSFVPIDWFGSDKTWADRNRAYLDGGRALFVQVARDALAKANLAPDQVDAVVTVSTTGIATPSIEAQVLTEMGFRPDIRRRPIFGLGCAGGVTGMAIAQSEALAWPGSTVLLVVLEACTLSFRQDQLTKADIISSVLFGDGAGAVILSADPDGDRLAALGTPYEETWPDTLDVMGWSVEDTGLGVVLDKSVPHLVKDRMPGAARRALSRSGRTMQDLDRLICHPGGAKVVESIERALHINQGALDIEREILRDYGNMSAATVLFVLEQALQRGIQGKLMMCALGPGFTATFMPLEVAND